MNKYIVGQIVYLLTQRGFVEAKILKLNEKTAKLSYQLSGCTPEENNISYDKIIGMDVPCCITYTNRGKIAINTCDFPAENKIREKRNFVYI
jgi:hypothetical protein